MSQKSTSWISEEDFYKPEKIDRSEAYAVIDIAQMNGQETPTSEPDGIQSTPSVVHRRHNGKKDTRREFPNAWFLVSNYWKTFYLPSPELQSGGKSSGLSVFIGYNLLTVLQLF